MKEAKKGARRFLQVRHGIVVPPVVLRAVLPDVASVVKNAMTAGSTKQAQPSLPSSQPQDKATMCKPRNQNEILNSFPCNICGRRFVSRRTLNEHSLSHVNECLTCKLPFSSKKLLLKHRCCICKVCNKPSASGNHKNCPRIFSCKCGEKFTHNRAFKTHQKVHVEIYGNCLTCSRQFTSETDLVDHVTKMKFPCIYCGTCYSNLDELSEHPDPKYSCEICTETFEDSFAAESHSRSHRAPKRSYTREPNVNAEKRTNAKELVNSVVEKVNLYEIPVEFDKEIDGKGDVKNDGGTWSFKIEEEPCDKLDGDLEERVEGAAPKLECVKVEFEDEEMRESNQETLDLHLEGVKEGNLTEKVDGVVTEMTFKLIESVNVETDGRDEDMRDGIENVDVFRNFGTGPSKPFVNDEFEFRDIKKEPDERIEVSNLGSDEGLVELGAAAPGRIRRTRARGPRRLPRAPVRMRVPAVYVGLKALRNTSTCKQEPALTNPPCVAEPSLVKPEPAFESEELDTNPSLKRECL